jgi:hypothetical protein
LQVSGNAAQRISSATPGNRASGGSGRNIENGAI